MSYEFFAYNFRCDVVHAHAAQASCTVDWLAKGISGTVSARHGLSGVWLMEPMPRQNSIAVGKPKWQPWGQRRRVLGHLSSGRCRAQSLAVSSVDLLGFNFGQLLKGMRHTLHAIGMILFDQRLVGLFDFLDRSGLGNAEDT